MIYFICYSWRILSSFKNNLYRSFTQFIILSLPELIESFPASKKKTDRKLIGKRPLPAPDVFSITHVPLTTRNVFVTCDTTQRTSFCNNNCGLKNFQSAVKANGFHIKWNWFWKPLSFDQKCGWQQLERSTMGWQTSLSFLSFYACSASGETDGLVDKILRCDHSKWNIYENTFIQLPGTVFQHFVKWSLEILINFGHFWKWKGLTEWSKENLVGLGHLHQCYTFFTIQISIFVAPEKTSNIYRCHYWFHYLVELVVVL